MILRNHQLGPFLVIMLFCTVLAGCQSSPESRLPGCLYLRLSTNPTTLDPALITDVMGGGIAAKIFNGLVRFNDKLDIVPDIAESWRISSDHRTYTFKLRKDATFSNGRRVTASDFQYSFERVLSPGTKASITWVLDRIKGARDVIAARTPHASGIRVIDDQTLELTLEKPFGPFLSLLGMSAAYVIPREAVTQFGPDFGSHPVGSGPYVLAEWLHGQSLTLFARNDYFDGHPRVKGIVYRVIPEDLTAVLEFETGGLDALQIPASEHRRYTSEPKWRNQIIGRPGLNCYYLGLNNRRPPFQDIRVRQAVNMAIDRRRILETIFEKRGILAAGPVPPPLWKFGMGPKDEGYSYEPERAKKMIREAGMEGKRIKIYISADPEVLDILEVIQQYLSRAGLIVEIVQLGWSAYKEALNKGEADAFWLSWWADYPDPENFFYPMFHSSNGGSAGNRTWYADRESDRLIEQAQSTPDERTRFTLYRRANDHIVRDAPWVFMWHRSDFYVFQQRVQDFKIYPIYSVDKGMDVSLK